MLHLTKVAFGCDSLEFLVERIAARGPDPARLTTRYRPKRHAEIVGGSLFWIIKHRLVARSEIVGFADSAEGRTDILIAPRVIAVASVAKRAHQGWRYLEHDKAPPDLIGAGADADAMPADMAVRLAELGLL